MKYLVAILLIVFMLSCSKEKEDKSKFKKFQQRIEEELSEEEEIESQFTLEESIEVIAEKEPIKQVDEKPVKKENLKPKNDPPQKVENNTKPNPSELWKKYKLAKQELDRAVVEKSLSDIIQALQSAASYATQLERPDIAAWQLNNIGFYSIEHFKEKTSYDIRMKRLNEMPYGDQKKRYYQETKKKMQEEFSPLKQAKPYLQKAKELDIQVPDQKRTRIIQNNLKFISEIEKMIQD